MENKPYEVNTERAKELQERALAMVPAFDSLTPEQVNDLIATKVMGWHKAGVFWVDEYAGMMAFIAPPDTDVRKSEFTPYHSLDDCWKAEDKVLREAMETDDAHSRLNKYEDALGLILRDSNVYQSITWFAAYHATAKQKCEAILKAIGEVV